VALTPDQLALLNGELAPEAWGGPDESELDEIFTLRGGLVGVVRQVWSTRLATLLASPATFAVSGEYSQSVSANIEAIRRRLFELSAYPDTGMVIPPNSSGVAFRVVPTVRVGQDR
jgi:hypothetical protein